MKTHCHNLNIHYTAPKEIWDQLSQLYAEMPGWNPLGGFPQWYGTGDGKRIEASVEPGGLQFYAELPQAEWDAWFSTFKRKASNVMGYEVGEPEDGFEFRFYD